jgi:hypothetical protein
MTDVIEVVSDEVHLAQSALVSQLIKTLVDRKKELAAESFIRMENGTKLTARQPGDSRRKLGTVSKSDPEPIATVVDREKFEEYIRSARPADLKVEWQLGPIEEVAAVLMEHAPHLVSAVEGVIPQWLLDVTKTEALSRDIPGCEVTYPAGVVSVRPLADAKRYVDELLAASSVPLLAIEARPEPGEPA